MGYLNIQITSIQEAPILIFSIKLLKNVISFLPKLPESHFLVLYKCKWEIISDKKKEFRFFENCKKTRVFGNVI